MIFEPARLKLHLACGPSYASQHPLRKLDVATLLTKGEFPPNLGLQRDPLPGLPRVTKKDKEKSAVTFRYRPVGQATAVYLSGKFNNWSKTAHKMSGPDKDGYYQTSQSLDPGRHEYKFVIESPVRRFDVWRNDPNNDDYTGPYRNSVIEVGR